MSGPVLILSYLGLAVAVLVFPALLVLRDSRVALGTLVIGGLVAFQSSADLSLVKMAYLVVLVLVLGVSVLDGSRIPTGIGSGPIIVLAGLTLAAVARGNDPLLVFRDTSNYLLLLVAAPIAGHFGRRLTSTFTLRICLVTGLLGTYVFASKWTANRGLATLPTFGAPSAVLVGLFVATTSTLALTSHRRWLWWTSTWLACGAALVTGTRNMLLLFAVPLCALAFSARRGPHRPRNVKRAAVRAVLALPVGLLLSVAAASASNVDLGKAVDRLASISEFDKVVGAGQSLAERQQQQSAAMAAIRSNLLLGSGAGTVWQWVTTRGETARSTTMDTSTVVAAKWGLVGALALAYLLYSWGRLLLDSPGRDEWWIISSSLAPFIVLQSLLNATIEDRGLPLTLVLLGAGSLASRRESLPSDTGSSSYTPESIDSQRVGVPTRPAPLGARVDPKNAA